MLKELIENNMILVLPNNMKENVIKEVSSLDKIYNIKFMSLKELIDSLTFTYDERSIYYLIKKYDKNIKLYPGHGDETTLGYEIENNIYMKGDFYE